MIVKMKKVSILSLASRKKELTTALRDFGALHLEIEEKLGDTMDSLREQELFLKQAIQAIPEGRSKKHKKTKNHQAENMPSLEEARKIATAIIEKAEILREKELEAEALRREIARVEEWGNFDPALFQDLLDARLELSFASLGKNDYAQLSGASRGEAPSGESPQGEAPRYIVLSKKNKKYRVLFVDTPPDNANYDFFQVPARSLAELGHAVETIVRDCAAITDNLKTYLDEKKILQHYYDLVLRDIEFASVEFTITDMEACPMLATINGYLPANELEGFRSFASAQGLAFVLQDPEADDNVPTKVENPRVIRIAEPIFQFMDTLPGYKEHDISFWFLIFFSLFFAMIIGDAGYGALMSLVSLGAMTSAKIKTGKIPNVIILFATFGLATLVWGALTGNWFGYEPIGDIPFFAQFVVPELDAFAEGLAADTVVETLLLFCFTLGAGHLILAHLLSFIKKAKESPRIHALADLGWISAMVGIYFLVLNLVVSGEKFPVPPFTLPLVFVGLAVILLFSGQEGDGFFRGLGRTLNIGSLIHTALTAIGAFADVISYIRLFAVGLASVEIARSFNVMAEGVMQPGTILGIVAGIVVLFIGHSLNLVMGGLSVLVHGIRLKMLEFSGHLGNEWTGFAYRPFKNI